MPDEIKLTMDAPGPQTPSLTLEGVETPSLTLSPEEAAPAPKQVREDEISTLDESVLSPEERKVVDDFAQKIDLTNSTLVLQYGSAAQKKIASFSDTTLNNVRTKDLGEVGDQISHLVVELKGFDIQEEEKEGHFRLLQKYRQQAHRHEGPLRQRRAERQQDRRGAGIPPGAAAQGHCHAGQALRDEPLLPQGAFHVHHRRQKEAEEGAGHHPGAAAEQGQADRSCRGRPGRQRLCPDVRQL